jgi:transposase
VRRARLIRTYGKAPVLDDRGGELKRLRREVREQQQTIEILKKATAFFVKENDR